LEYSITIVVHASDCKAIQCKPIDKQSALIVAIRPAQRNMTARLITALFHVNWRRRGCNDALLAIGWQPMGYGPVPQSRDAPQIAASY
jgi:hypothetical protein